MPPGFALRRLEVTGPGKEPAIQEFADGLNVISGPSDTGKTYIVQCIDYCLGAGTPPEANTAATGYTQASVVIEGRDDGVRRTLARSLQGGNVELIVDGEEPRTLKAQHREDDISTVSGYLLELCQSVGYRVRRTAHGAKRGLSFRDFAHLAIVDEEKVIHRSPPSRTPHGRDATVEDRVFRFVLTGEDDSSVVPDEDPKKLKERRGGRAELVEQLLADLQRDRARVPVRVDDVATGELRLRELDDQLAKDTAELNAAEATAAELEERRRPVWEALHAVQSRLAVMRELVTRFELLKEQYESDLQRLAAIAEAGGRLDELSEERCQICGALAIHHDRDHARGLPAPGDIVASSNAEAAKIRKLARDLEATTAATVTDIERLAAEQDRTAAALAAVDTEIGAKARPRLAQLTAALRNGESQRRRLSAALDLRRRETQLETLLQEAREPVRKGSFTGSLAGPTSAEAEPFALNVEAQLRAWNFPDLSRVTFSDEAQDVVVSGQPRRGRGKGVRALTHAAFTLGLLRLTLDLGRPFPGLVVIDSPLVVYEEPDPDEDGFPLDVKDAFYRAIAAEFRDAQVVVVENVGPPSDLAANASLTHFTKTNHGRYGFIPS